MNREELATADQDAYEDYQKLLQEAPDYPDKQAIYRRLLPLAQKLNKAAEAEQYEAALRPATGNNGNGSGGR
jgi:hypothetical protein